MTKHVCHARDTISRAVLPIIVLLTLAVLLITYVPWLTMALPNSLEK